MQGGNKNKNAMPASSKPGTIAAVLHATKANSSGDKSSISSSGAPAGGAGGPVDADTRTDVAGVQSDGTSAADAVNGVAPLPAAPHVGSKLTGGGEALLSSGRFKGEGNGSEGTHNDGGAAVQTAATAADGVNSAAAVMDSHRPLAVKVTVTSSLGTSHQRQRQPQQRQQGSKSKAADVLTKPSVTRPSFVSGGRVEGLEAPRAIPARTDTAASARGPYVSQAVTATAKHIQRDVESAKLMLRARKLDLAAREWAGLRGLLLRRATRRAAAGSGAGTRGRDDSPASGDLLNFPSAVVVMMKPFVCPSYFSHDGHLSYRPVAAGRRSKPPVIPLPSP